MFTNENKILSVLMNIRIFYFLQKLILHNTPHLPIELYPKSFQGLLRISRRSFSFFSNKINKTSSNKSTCKSSSREIKDSGPRFPVRKIKVRLLPNLFLARAYCYFYSRLIIIVPLVDKSGHSISFILHLFMSSCSKIGN